MTGLEGFSTGSEEKPKDIIELALDHLRDNFHFATFEETDEILFYDNGVYLKGGEVIIKREIENKFQEKATIHVCREVTDHVRRRTYHKRSEFDSDLNIINLKNGLYSISEDKLQPHRPDYLSLRQKPIPYDKKAPVPRKCIQYLKQVTYPTDLWTLVELIAYTFWRDNPYEVITTILGGGHNGKSVLFGLLTALHGQDNVSNVSMKTIAESPYGLHDLVDKDCNLNEEMTSAYLHDTATLKKVTGRGRVRVEQKWKAAYDTTLHAKLWVCANRLPKADDDSLAWYKRNIIIAFPNTFIDGCCADRGQLAKLTTQEELSGIFNLLMFALRRILKEGKIFLNSLSVEERQEKYERASNPIPAFLEEAISEESFESNCVTKALFYAAYEYYCNKYKLAKESLISFGRVLKQRHDFKDDKQYDEQKKQVRVWTGIALTEEYLNAIIGRQETLDTHATP